MNINLVSPKGNGNDYTIRFKEDIIIPENSKTYLNFATLSRDNEVEFFEDQTIEILINNNDVIPRLRPQDGTDINPLTKGGTLNNTFTIKEGRYSYQKLFSLLTLGIQGVLDAADEVDLRFYRALSRDDLDIDGIIKQAGQEVLSVGLIRERKDDQTEMIGFTPHGTHKHNAAQVLNGDPVAYVKSNANTANPNFPARKIIDSYMLSADHIYPFLLKGNTPFKDLEIIEFTSAQTIQDIINDGAICHFGLYSSGVADGLNEGGDGAFPLNDANRTSGAANPKTFPNDNVDSRKSLAMFFGVEFGLLGGANCLLQVKGCRSSTIVSPNNNIAQRGPQHWDCINRPITGMTRLRQGGALRVDTDLGYGLHEHLHIGIQCYIEDKGEKSRRFGQATTAKSTRAIHFRVLNLRHTFNPDAPLTDTSNVGGVIYDSKINSQFNMPPAYANPIGGQFNTFRLGRQFQICETPASLDYTTGTAAQKSRKINSQIGLNIIMASDTQNHGFDEVNGPFFNHTDARPKVAIYRYALRATDELARYLNFALNKDINSGAEREKVLLPNTRDAMSSDIIHIEDMNLDWRNESYSIFLKELPIKNYKNNDRVANGGFAKNILANLPVPFSDAQSYPTGNKSMISATYAPNYQVVNNLYNQEIATNRFSVEIRNLQNDRPATQIKESVINFTIVPPDDYKGNINSVQPLLNQ